MNSETKIKIFVAVILGGSAIIAGALSNWDKLFPNKGIISASYSGYKPTDNFETELRHYLNVSGTRYAHESFQKQIAEAGMIQLISEFPEENDKIQSIMSIALDEVETFDEQLNMYLPVYKNHFTIQELHELNKFYSTEVMQNHVRKLPLLTQEMSSIEAKRIIDYQKRVIEKAYELLDIKK